jgi:uncharacterized protein
LETEHLKHLVITETFDFAPSSRVYTDNGFLRVKGKAARTGVYQYLASELGLTDRPANSIVNVLRSSDEVFNADSLATYANVDVTNDHPSALVDASTFKSTSVGHVIGATRDGDFVEVEMIIKDAKAIKDVESGKSQLSPGYTAVYVAEVGTYDATGESYEFKQTGIDVNHVAVVKRGRGGAQVRIDDNQGVTPMIKVTLDSGRSIDVADEAVAALVTDSIERLTKRVTDAEAKMEEAKAKADMKEEELEAEKAKTTDAAIAERVEAISTVRAQAVKMVGDTFTCDSVDVVAIQRAALTAKRPTIDWATKSDVYVQASFDMALSEPSQAQPANQLTQFAKDAASLVNVADAKPSGYQTFKDKQSNAWKGE